MNVQTAEKEKQAAPDFRLVIRTLEKKLLADEAPEKCRRVLEQEKIWKRLSPPMRLKWARLSQMAGAVDTALAVLSALNREHPEMAEAWEDRMEMLSVMGEEKERARVAALRRGRTGERMRAAGTGELRTASGDDDVPEDFMALQGAGAPFSALRKQEDGVNRFLRLFSGREDSFARQWADRDGGRQGYMPVRRPMTPGDAEDHLRGRKTYGIYLLRRDATVTTAVIDADVIPELRGRRRTKDENTRIRAEQKHLFRRVDELSGQCGLSPLLEFSGGKGYHFWYFFSKPVPAGRAKAALEAVRDRVAGELTVFNLEVFPKQERLKGKGLGNLVKLPLGIHRLSGKPSWFVNCPDRSQEAQLVFLETVTPAAPESIRPLSPEASCEVLAHPKLKGAAGVLNDPAFRDLRDLETFCPPLADAFAACRSGEGLTLSREKVIFQTLGFLPKARMIIHHLMAQMPDYNPHRTDYQMSRIRGTPLGCRRIHTLMAYDGPFCDFQGRRKGYAHPLLHVGWEAGGKSPKAEKAVNLSEALDFLKTAVMRVERFL